MHTYITSARPGMRALLCLLACALACALTSCGGGDPAPNTPQPPVQVRGIVGESVASSGYASIAQALSPCVVGLSTVNVKGDGYQQRVVEGVGSGVIVDSEGYVLTNHHVVGDTTRLTVVLHDGSQTAGRVLWSDASLDLAIVKIEGAFPWAPLGTLEGVMVGDAVLAIGTPLTLTFQHTVTAGIVSAVNRTLEVPTDGGSSFLESLIQTDASINPGNSGGPLINMRGEVVGINTLKVTEAEGIGFAIPIDIAKPILRHFKEDGAYETPYLGVFGLDKEIARYYDSTITLKEGLYALNIDPYGPAAQAGIRAGDVLTALDGRAIATMLDMRAALFERKVGEDITLTLIRDDRRLDMTVTLDKNPVSR